MVYFIIQSSVNIYDCYKRDARFSWNGCRCLICLCVYRAQILFLWNEYMNERINRQIDEYLSWLRIHYLNIVFKKQSSGYPLVQSGLPSDLGLDYEVNNFFPLHEGLYLKFILSLPLAFLQFYFIIDIQFFISYFLFSSVLSNLKLNR